MNSAHSRQKPMLSDLEKSRVGDTISPVVFFDGVCGLCNSFVDLILEIDKNDTFLYAPLQGESADKLLPPLENNPEEWSIVYLDEDGLHERSDAVVKIAQQLGGIWALVGLLRFVPKGVRDFVYRFVARIRYRWFGKKDRCRIPTPEEEKHFLP